MNRPIGVIDSGIGGLTVLQELERQLPNEEYVYLGDTLRCPYGTKEKEDVIEYTLEMVHYLISYDIKLLVIACNTATAILLDELKEKLSIPVIGVVEPGARAAIKSTQSNHVGIIGTTNTIKSGAYEDALLNFNPNIKTTGIACPKFVPMIEKGMVTGDYVKEVIKESLLPFQSIAELDTLILGCTHYPIIQELIKEVVGEQVTVLSSALETAHEVSAVLTFSDAHHEPMQSAIEPLIFTTGETYSFENFNSELKQFAHLNMKKVQLNVTRTWQ